MTATTTSTRRLIIVEVRRRASSSAAALRVKVTDDGHQIDAGPATAELDARPRHLIIVEDDGHQIDAGPATAAQLEASDDAADRGQDGLIQIDADGDPVAPGAWYQGQLRTAYVEL